MLRIHTEPREDGMWHCTKNCFAMHKIDIMFVHGL
jgi:hypothetical protein